MELSGTFGSRQLRRAFIRADAGDANDRVDLLIGQGVRVASFALAPKPHLIARLKDAGVVVIPSVGAAKHARKVAGWGADAVIVQGGEGGGHTGPVATTLLLTYECWFHYSGNLHPPPRPRGCGAFPAPRVGCCR